MEYFMDLVFRHAPIGLIFAEDRVIRWCNKRFSEMFGYRPDELEAQSIEKLYPTPEEYERIGDIGRKQMLGLGHYADERIMRRKDGTLFWCRVRGQSLDADAPFSQSVWSFADISDNRPITEMTMRERQVAKMMAEGLTTKEIARLLEISPRTVDVYRTRLLSKFEARNSIELVARLTGIPM
ncbi:PAS and helix-turn-helix domain-containing protein [Aliiroseovarius sp. S1339]|uniref:PAS and helix-turn-helix domain-containing protein n=1 Tax=Aliiroseovarius sp. S1339 TaxID=2936990 RepID=UPI0020C05378|nr:PAS and helix-turn-helix domain-containing protein [Aliiroseovarius sp. S1339]MCK8465062.1 PAS and helix-turn-helix domain-containing protein [Aliiroseovarius sp. S1339]